MKLKTYKFIYTYTRKYGNGCDLVERQTYFIDAYTYREALDKFYDADFWFDNILSVTWMPRTQCHTEAELAEDRMLHRLGCDYDEVMAYVENHVGVLMDDDITIPLHEMLREAITILETPWMNEKESFMYARQLLERIDLVLFEKSISTQH